MTDELIHELPDGVADRTVNQNGVIEYRDAEGRFHRPDGPALIHPDKATYWLVTGKNPSEMPTGWFGYQAWLWHGRVTAPTDNQS